MPERSVLSTRDAGRIVGRVAAVAVTIGLALSATALAGPSSGSKAEARSVKVAPKTIGLVHFFGAAASSQEIQADAANAARFLGWRLIICDPAGVPQRMASCMTSLVAQNPAAIMVVSIEPSLIRDGLEQAKAKRIPVVDVGGTVQNPAPYDGMFSPSDSRQGEVLTKRMVKDLGPNGGEVAAFLNDSVYSLKLRGTALESVLKKAAKVKLVAKVQASQYTNTFANSQQDTLALLRAHPNLKAIWASAGTTYLPGILAGLDAAGKTGQVKVYGINAQAATLDMVKENKLDALVGVHVGQSAYVAIDQFLRRFEQNKPIVRNAVPLRYSYQIITQANLKRETRRTKYPLWFQQRWEKLYK
jgi:ABC-type sugar transport system substrate-binding protein